MSIKKSNNEDDICIKLAESIEQNFNKVLSNSEINKKYDFDDICEILDIFVKKINVVKDKKNKTEYEKGKKRFARFLAYNYDFIKNNFTVNKEYDDKIIQLFEDGPNENWNLLHLIMISYLSYLNQTSEDKTINYKGMIAKLLEKIDDYESSNNSEEKIEEKPKNSEKLNEQEIKKNLEDLKNINPQQLLNEVKNKLPQTKNSQEAISNILGDIKGMLNTGEIDAKNIVDVSKNLSSKYQNLIETGKMDMGDLLSGLVGLISDPKIIQNEFKDLENEKLPDPSKLLSEISNDPKLKQTMNMLTGSNEKSFNFGNMGSILSGLLGSSEIKDDPEAPKTVQGLEKDIERMMLEIEEAENKETENKETK